MKLTYVRRALLVAAAALLPTAASAEVLVASQNTLHLGQNSAAVPNYIAGKNDFVRGLAHWPGNSLPQLTFLQEVMRQASEAAIQPQGATVRFSALKGTSSYLERYGIVAVNDAGNHLVILCHVDTASLVTTGFTMERPPEATLVQDTSGARPQQLWLLNFHAVFGANAGLRRAEAAEMGKIVARLRAATPAGCPRTSDNVVVLGDWNLNGNDAAFNTLAANAGFTRVRISPNVPTSLNASGARASAYDHFVWDDARVEVTLVNLPSQALCGTTIRVTTGVLIPASLPAFRRNCSDHLGVAARVRVR